MKRLPLILLCMVMLLPGSASADDWSRGGRYEGDGIVLELEPADQPGRYAGRLAIGGEEYPVDARDAGDGLDGVFTAGGKRYRFSMRFSGETARLLSDGEEYRLRFSGRGGDNPLNRRNRPRPRQEDEINRDGGDGGVLEHPQRAPRNWRIVQARGVRGRILLREDLTGNDGRQVMFAALRELGQYFDEPPQVTNGFLDSTSGQAQAMIAGTLGGTIFRGHVTANADGKVGVIYDTPEAFPDSIEPLTKEMIEALPELGDMSVPFQEHRFPDGSGRMKLPKNFKITDAHGATVDVAGPNGEFMNLGLAIPMMTGEDPMGMLPPQRGPTFSAIPRNPVEAMHSACRVINAILAMQPPSQVTEIVRVVEAAPVDFLPNWQAAWILVDIRVTKPGERPQDLRALGLFGFTAIDRGQWMYYQSIVGAPPKRFRQALPGMLQAWQSWKIEEKELLKRAKKVHETQQEITKIIQEATQDRQETFEKVMARWGTYSRGTTPVRNNKTGKIEEKPSYGPQEPGVDPDTGRPRDANQDIDKWMEEENRKAGYERYEEIDPYQARKEQDG